MKKIKWQAAALMALVALTYAALTALTPAASQVDTPPWPPVRVWWAALVALAALAYLVNLVILTSATSWANALPRPYPRLWQAALIALIVLAAAAILTAIASTAAAAPRPADLPQPSDRLWWAVCEHESGGRPWGSVPRGAAGEEGRAQIRPIMIEDANRIAETLGLGERFTLADRFDPAKARRVFDLFLGWYAYAYKQAGPEAFARMWNGGPRGYRKASTVTYWRDKVEPIYAKGTTNGEATETADVRCEGKP